MFEEFRAAFGHTEQGSDNSNSELLAKVEPYANGFTELLTKFGGSTFENGLYRLHSGRDIPMWTLYVESAFPQFKGRIVCFAFDWLGRHFALDKKRVNDHQMQVLLFEPGAGEVMQIPANFHLFHNSELVQFRNDALASDFFSQWLDSGGTSPNHAQCIGYKVPLFLGGTDTIDNLEVSDMDVYWAVCTQTLQARSNN